MTERSTFREEKSRLPDKAIMDLLSFMLDAACIVFSFLMSSHRVGWCRNGGAWRKMLHKGDAVARWMKHTVIHVGTGNQQPASMGEADVRCQPGIWDGLPIK